MRWRNLNYLVLLTLVFNTTVGTSKGRKPYIKKYSAKVSVSIGQPATLFCRFSGNPPPQVNWTKLDEGGHKIPEKCEKCIYKLINSRPGISTLKVSPFKDEDFGRYECRFRNKYGVALKKMTLKKVNLTDITHCKYDRILARDPRLRIGYLPKCDLDGKYHKVQCSVHTSDCWCVDRDNGHKNADAYPSEGGFHCTPPKDIKSSAIVTIIFAVLFLLLLQDVFLLVTYKKGLTAMCLKKFLAWRSKRQKLQAELIDPEEPKRLKVDDTSQETESPKKDKKRRKKKKKRKNEVYHVVNLDDDGGDVNELSEPKD